MAAGGKQDKDKSSHIYGIVVNFPFDLKDPPREWKFCKIGHTKVDTAPGVGNRMETVRDQIKTIYGMKAATVLFVLRVSGNTQKEEKRVRCAFGHEVPKEIAQKLKFPVITEWVLTTQKFIDGFRQKISAMEKGFASTALLDDDLEFDFGQFPLPAGLQDL